MEKTNSCKSMKQNSKIHIPYYFESGFLVPKEKEKKITFEGTEEEKAIIRKQLIEKGVLVSDEKVCISGGVLEGESDSAHIESVETTSEEPKKKKGRPKKGNK